MQDIIQMCSFDGAKSTKGASKLRRDLINSEISQLRDLLPLPPSTRQRLSQLQLMALVCVYVRKSNYFQQVLKHQDTSLPQTPNMGFSKALNGFIMMMTQGGKLLFISDNAAEYLGHSMEDLLIHGDSVFDIIDKQDHSAVQAELVRGVQGSVAPDDDRYFLCRMNVSRNARRQMRFGDQKVVLIRGHYVSYLPLCSRNEPVFLAHCTPVAMPETRESVVQGATNVFTSVHTLDMKFIHIDRNGEYYLGYSSTHLAGVSWYHLIHPDSLRDAQSKHKLITSNEQERSTILLLRLQTATGSWKWVHCVLQVKESGESTPQIPTTTTQTSSTTQTTQQPVIIATNQIIGDKEAAVLRTNSWLYHYFAMQSKLQYGLSYEAHTQRMHPYYSQVLPYQNDATAHYMTTSLSGTAIATSAGAHPSPTYPLTAGAPYLQPYPHPYSVKLHHGFEYSRDSSWNYCHTAPQTDGTNSYQVPSQYHSPTNSPYHGSPYPSKSQKRMTSLKASPRRSPTISTSMSSSESIGGVAVITPVAIRPTIGNDISKKVVCDMEDVEISSWKSSPIQEVPDGYEIPFITPPYSATPTKPLNFNFDALEAKNSLIRDHQVPSLDRSETQWSPDMNIRSPWLPAEEITGPLRILNQAP